MPRRLWRHARRSQMTSRGSCDPARSEAQRTKRRFTNPEAGFLRVEGLKWLVVDFDMVAFWVLKLKGCDRVALIRQVAEDVGVV